MKIKNCVTLALLSGLVLSLILSTDLSALEKNQQKKEKESKPIYIPKEVKAVFEKGMATREARLDIPFSIVKTLYFPAQINLHTIFFLKAKNADLGFAPVSATSGAQEKKKEKEEALTAFETEATKLQAKFHFFIQFNRLDNGRLGDVAYEVFVPVNIQIRSNDYDPDKEDIYSVGYPVAPGNYLVSTAIASQNLEKIGTQYFELSLPDPVSFAETIDTTPLFFFKAMPDLPAPETRPIAHMGYFTYSILQFIPLLQPTFSPGDTMEIFFYVFGSQATEDMKYDIEVSYEVLKGEEKTLRWAPQTYETPLVDQPLPLEKTVLIRSDSGEERTEKRPLEPGKYTLSLTITDKISGKSSTKTIDFAVK